MSLQTRSAIFDICGNKQERVMYFITNSPNMLTVYGRYTVTSGSLSKVVCEADEEIHCTKARSVQTNYAQPSAMNSPCLHFCKMHWFTSLPALTTEEWSYNEPTHIFFTLIKISRKSSYTTFKCYVSEFIDNKHICQLFLKCEKFCVFSDPSFTFTNRIVCRLGLHLTLSSGSLLRRREGV